MFVNDCKYYPLIEHFHNEIYSFVQEQGIRVYNGLLFADNDLGMFIDQYISQFLVDAMSNAIMVDMLRTSGNLVGLMTYIAASANTPSIMDVMVCMSMLTILGNVIFPFSQKHNTKFIYSDDNYERHFVKASESFSLYKKTVNDIFLRRFILAISILKRMNKINSENFEAAFLMAGLPNLYHKKSTYYYDVTQAYAICWSFVPMPQHVRTMFSNQTSHIWFSLPLYSYDTRIHTNLIRAMYQTSNYLGNRQTDDSFYASIFARIYFLYSFNNLDSYVRYYQNIMYSDANYVNIFKYGESKYTLMDILECIDNYDNFSQSNEERKKNIKKLLDSIFELVEYTEKAGLFIFDVFFEKDLDFHSTQKFRVNDVNLNDVPYLTEIGQLYKEIIDVTNVDVGHDFFSVDVVYNDAVKFLNLLVGEFVSLKQYKRQYFGMIEYNMSADVSIYYLHMFYYIQKNIDDVSSFCEDKIKKLITTKFNISPVAVYNYIAERTRHCEVIPTENESTLEDDNSEFIVLIDDIINYLKILNPELKNTYIAFPNY